MYTLIAKNKDGRTIFNLDSIEKVNMIKAMLIHHYRDTEIKVIVKLEYQN